MARGFTGFVLIIALLGPASRLAAQHHGGHHPHFAFGIGSYGYLPPVVYGPRYGFFPGYAFYGYSVNGVGLSVWPPVVAPAQPIVAGPNPNVAPLGAPAAPQVAAQPQAAPAPEPRPERKPRVANIEAKTRAGKFIDAGDRLFRQQRFREALERYKLAGPQAPDMAEIYLRQGFAEAAIGQYETAGRLFRRGLKLQASWRPGELQLNDLYGPDHQLAKSAHFEALAQAAQAAPHDPNLLFVLAMELHFDGQLDRAGPFFLRASQLGANEDHLLDDFVAAAMAGVAGGANAAGANPPAAKGPILDM